MVLCTKLLRRPAISIFVGAQAGAGAAFCCLLFLYITYELCVFLARKAFIMMLVYVGHQGYTPNRRTTATWCSACVISPCDMSLSHFTRVRRTARFI
jgi:hypothetical protein